MSRLIDSPVHCLGSSPVFEFQYIMQFGTVMEGDRFEQSVGIENGIGIENREYIFIHKNSRYYTQM